MLAVSGLSASSFICAANLFVTSVGVASPSVWSREKIVRMCVQCVLWLFQLPAYKQDSRYDLFDLQPSWEAAARLVVVGLNK